MFSWGVRVQEIFVEVDGHRVRLERSGSGAPLLLLHGLVGSTANWRRNVDSFSRRSTVYAVDLLNMGGSDRVPGLDASLEASADRIAALLDQLELAAVDLAAHSHGGAIAMMFAARHPQRVHRLILFAPANPFCDLSAGIRRFYTSRIGLWFARSIPRLPRHWKAIALGRMYGDPDRVPEDALSGYTDGLAVPGTINHILQIVGRWSVDMAQLRRCLSVLAEIPTLLVWGERDRAVGLASAHELCSTLHRAQLLTLPGVGHIAFEEVPELVNPAVERWLRSTESVPLSPISSRIGIQRA